MPKGKIQRVLAVLGESGGANDLNLAPAQGGLENVGGVHGALGVAGAHDVVHLVDDQDDVAQLLDLLDENGEPSGQVRERTLVHLNGDWHRTSHVWVVRRRRDGGHDLLLQKRSREKDSFGGCYDISSAGHIPAGQDYLESALRELKEELGIAAEPEDLRLVGVHDGRYEGEFHGRIFKNHEKSHVFAYEKPVEIEKLKLQKEEVESVKWMRIEDVLAAVKAHDPGYCLFEDEIEMLSEVLA